MLRCIEVVEATRNKRLKETFSFMNLKERQEILENFHPDYKKGTKRPLRIGPNEGCPVSNEVADLLEAHALVKPEEIDLSQIDFDVDVLIIGGGGGGMTAALWAKYSGVDREKILIVQKLRLGDSNSIMSQGGVQAAIRPNDSPVLHYLDVIGGGHFSNDVNLVRRLVLDGPLIIQWHEEIGVMYDKEIDGEMVAIHGGGTSKKRMCSARDYTGLEIIRNLKDEIVNEGISVLEFTSVVELLCDEQKQVVGAVLLNMETREYYVVTAKSVVLTTGGFGRLHIQDYPTTNHYGATADGIVLAYRIGAKLRDLDSVQYHPTGAAYPEQIVGLLVTEKVRGLGAQLVNKYGEQFVNPREPRDIESSAIIRECYAMNKGVETTTGLRGVWLDSPMIDLIHGAGTTEKLLPAMVRQYKRFCINITRDPILVFPTLHFQNGGIIITEETETSVSGLFAAGEVTGGTHGRNRLMGNSILDYSVFGRIAGINAAKRAEKVKIGKPTLKHVIQYEKMLKDAGIKTERKAPILLPEYRGEKTLSRSLSIL